ncbi:Npt1/Npt2 family nucleotide transporter [Candidatus Aquarickettsia rohweri]|uniref:ADP,ATP carrier protein n=2 Tax=Rickettsiales TaxID=766 RepID=A0A3R9ZQK4_9RICK|nr:Npt1/Npt2 family nucleotide transporter [Candidatus Aquarickettsia rohweri]RST69240.1 NTP/NDP exchange transporter [Candidatus Aquarickettsia rohweri]
MKYLLNLIPIKKDEISRFIVISLMMLMILFIYSIERTVKDTIVINEMGAELISAIKLYCTMPIAILMMLIYAKLSNELNKTTIFHLFNGFFITYFLIFTFVINPNISYFHFDFNGTKNNYPYLSYFIAIIENWSYSLYFVLAELWGSVMLSLMFWQTANQVFKITEAKRLYPLFGLVAQLGLITSGGLLRLFSNKNICKSGWQQSLEYINYSVLFAGISLSVLYFILTNVLVSKDIINAETIKKKKKEGFIKSLKHVFTSKYIGLIALLILCYGISINIVEGVWKAQAGAVYTDKQDYARFMSNLQTYTGLASMSAMLFGSYILSKISWKTAALLTPIIILITGVAFFIFSIYQMEIVEVIPFLTLAPIVVAVFIGLMQNILGKATKYAFFDATKEIAYIPLDESLKSKGKAAADVIGGRLGKSGGALIQQFLLILALIFNPSLVSLEPGEALISLSSILFIIFLVIMIIWLLSVGVLSKEFNKLTKNKKD